MNEELEYVLETIKFKTSIYRDKKKRNLTFNDDDYYSNILNEYITNLQQENARLKDKIEKVIEYVNHYETIRGYYEYEECGYDEYNYEEDLKEELLELLKEN